MCSGKGTIVLGKVFVSLAFCDSLVAICYFGKRRGVGSVWFGWVFCGSRLVLFLLRKEDIFD